MAALAGWAEARPVNAARARKIADRAERLLSRWPDHADLFRVRADALFRAAEGVEPVWEPARLREAVLAVERLRAKLPDDPQAALALGWLRLAENNPERALRDVAPLRTPEIDPTLSAAQIELLGAIYRQTGKLDDAVRLLERAAAEQNAAGRGVRAAGAGVPRPGPAGRRPDRPGSRPQPPPVPARTRRLRRRRPGHSEVDCVGRVEPSRPAGFSPQRGGEIIAQGVSPGYG